MYKKRVIQVVSHVVERLKTQDFRKQRNIRKIIKLGGDPVSLPEKKTFEIVVKNYVKLGIKVV